MITTEKHLHEIAAERELFEAVEQALAGTDLIEFARTVRKSGAFVDRYRIVQGNPGPNLLIYVGTRSVEISFSDKFRGQIAKMRIEREQDGSLLIGPVQARDVQGIAVPLNDEQRLAAHSIAWRAAVAVGRELERDPETTLPPSRWSDS